MLYKTAEIDLDENDQIKRTQKFDVFGWTQKNSVFKKLLIA